MTAQPQTMNLVQVLHIHSLGLGYRHRIGVDNSTQENSYRGHTTFLQNFLAFLQKGASGGWVKSERVITGCESPSHSVLTQREVHTYMYIAASDSARMVGPAERKLLGTLPFHDKSQMVLQRPL